MTIDGVISVLSMISTNQSIIKQIKCQKSKNNVIESVKCEERKVQTDRIL